MFELWLFEQVTAQSALTYFKPVGRDFCQVKMSEVIQAPGNWLAQIVGEVFGGATKLVIAIFVGVQGILKVVIDGATKLLIVIIDGIKTILPVTAEFLKEITPMLSASQNQEFLKSICPR